jgi:hypothetical protein
MAQSAALSRAFEVVKQSTADATQELIAKVAKREHGKIMATEPRPGGFTRWVDGRRDAPEESVRADGLIYYLYARLDMVAQFALETLFDLSPVRSGRYRDSHTLFLNGTAVANLKSGGQATTSR